MAIADDIVASRECGVVHCGVSSRPRPTLAELAAEFGLSDDAGLYHEIDATSAQRLVQSVITRDLTYDSEIVPLARASELAALFLAQFGAEGVRFYTNRGVRDVAGPDHRALADSWNPATSATFDTGVLVIGPTCSGCLWVEDED